MTPAAGLQCCWPLPVSEAPDSARPANHAAFAPCTISLYRSFAHATLFWHARKGWHVLDATAGYYHLTSSRPCSAVSRAETMPIKTPVKVAHRVPHCLNSCTARFRRTFAAQGEGSHSLLRCRYRGSGRSLGRRKGILDYACQAGHPVYERLHRVGSLLAGLGLRLRLCLCLRLRLQVHLPFIQMPGMRYMATQDFMIPALSGMKKSERSYRRLSPGIGETTRSVVRPVKGSMSSGYCGTKFEAWETACVTLVNALLHLHHQHVVSCQSSRRQQPRWVAGQLRRCLRHP